MTDACKLLRTSSVTIDQDRVDLGEDVEEVTAAAAEGDMVMNQGEDDDVMQSSMIVSNGLLSATLLMSEIFLLKSSKRFTVILNGMI